MDVNENLEKRARGGWGIIHLSDARDFVLLHFSKYSVQKDDMPVVSFLKLMCNDIFCLFLQYEDVLSSR